MVESQFSRSRIASPKDDPKIMWTKEHLRLLIDERKIRTLNITISWVLVERIFGIASQIRSMGNLIPLTPDTNARESSKVS